MDANADLSLNTIIIALLLLLVFVVLALIFTGKIGFFTASLDACPGTCQASPTCADGSIGVKKERCYDELSDANGDGSINTEDHIAGALYCCKR